MNGLRRVTLLTSHRLKILADLKNLSTCPKWPIKQVEIQTCGALYEIWRKEKPGYGRAPKDGLTFKVEYVDTKNCVQTADHPVVLSLHGSPGSHRDYGPLIDHLAPKGVRLIAPNFPEYSITDSTPFRHTVEEKAEYLKDFLKALDVKKIDMLVTHSSGCYPGLRLWRTNELPEIKSLVLINPAGHRRIKAMKPKWFIDNSVKIYLNPVGRWLYRKIGAIVFKLIPISVKVQSIDNVLLAATTMYFADIQKLPMFLQEVRENQVPLLYMFSENDGLVDKKVFYEMADMLGVEQSHLTVYDKDGNLERQGSHGWNTSLCFRDGGHYAFLKHNKIANVWIEDLLSRVYQSDKQRPLAYEFVNAEEQHERVRIKTRTC